MVKRICTALFVLFLGASTASAQDANEARRLFEQGVAAASRQSWPDAIDAFRRSFAIVERASTAYNLAVALGRAERPREALAALDDYFRLANQSEASEAERYRQATELRTRLEGRVARLTLTIAPATATVSVVGTAIEGSGAERTLLLDPGSHRVTVAAGDRTEDIEITLAAGETQTRTVNLEQGGAAQPEPQPAQPSGGDAFGVLGIVGVVLAGVGAASFGVMIGTGVVSNDTYETLRSECTENADGTFSCGAEWRDEISFGSDMALTSTIFTVIGGVTLAAGLALIIVDVADGGGESARLEITTGPGLAGLGARGRF